MRLVTVAASLRKESYNRKLLLQAVRECRALDIEVDNLDFGEILCPNYDGDAEAKTGIAQGALRFATSLAAADGIILASPEYNFSIPGVLKNVIDWTSRIRPTPFRGLSGLLLSASAGAIGGIRGLWQLRIPLEGCGVVVFPDMYSLPNAGSAFTKEGGLEDKSRSDRLVSLLKNFLEFSELLAPKRRSVGS